MSQLTGTGNSAVQPRRPSAAGPLEGSGRQPGTADGAAPVGAAQTQPQEILPDRTTPAQVHGSSVPLPPPALHEQPLPADTFASPLPKSQRALGEQKYEALRGEPRKTVQTPKGQRHPQSALSKLPPGGPMQRGGGATHATPLSSSSQSRPVPPQTVKKSDLPSLDEEAVTPTGHRLKPESKVQDGDKVDEALPPIQDAKQHSSVSSSSTSTRSDDVVHIHQTPALLKTAGPQSAWLQTLNDGKRELPLEPEPSELPAQQLDDSDLEAQPVDPKTLGAFLGWQSSVDDLPVRERLFIESFAPAHQRHAMGLLRHAASRGIFQLNEPAPAAQAGADGATRESKTTSGTSEPEVSRDAKAEPEIQDGPYEEFFNLAMTYDKLVSIPLREGRDDLRALSTLRVLMGKSVSPREMETLVHEGRVRDFWRKLASMMTVWGWGFGLGGGATVLGSEHPYFDAKAAGLSADEQFVQKRANLATSYSVSNAVIGVGGEVAATIVREGEMDMTYNQAVGRDAKGQRIRFADSDEGRKVYWQTFLGFPVGHGLVDGLLRNEEPLVQAKMRMISSPAAALAGAIYRAYNELNATEVDVVWLDARTPEKAARCMKAIDDLRKPRQEAIRGYFADNVWEGMKGLVKDEDGYGLPGADAILRALVRTVVIATLQSGRLVPALAPGQWAWAANLVTDAFIGTWGEANRLPQRVVDRVAAGAARQKQRSQPAPVQQVVPPGLQRPAGQEPPIDELQDTLADLSRLRRRRPFAGNPGDLG